MLLGACCCGNTCLIDSDDFNRADNVAIGDKWTDSNSRITGGRLTQQAVGASSAITVKQHNSELMVVDCSMAFTSSSITVDLGMVAVNYLDSNNYLYIQVEVISSAFAGTISTKLKFFRRSGGVSTQQGATRTIDASNGIVNHQIRLCYDGTYMRAMGHIQAVAKIAGGFKAGLLTSASSAVFHDDFKWYRFASGCPKCTELAYCFRCPQGLSSYIVIDFGVGGLSAGFCAGCANIVGEYVLKNVPPNAAGQGNPCYWRYDGTVCISGICTLTFNVIAEMLRTSVGTLYWQVILQIPPIPACGMIFFTTVYQSATFTEANCTTTPVTLNRISTAGTACAGTLPATAELRIV